MSATQAKPKRNLRKRKLDVDYTFEPKLELERRDTYVPPTSERASAPASTTTVQTIRTVSVPPRACVRFSRRFCPCTHASRGRYPCPEGHCTAHFHWPLGITPDPY